MHSQESGRRCRSYLSDTLKEVVHMLSYLKTRVRRHLNVVVFRLQKQTAGKNKLRKIIVEKLLDGDGTENLVIVDDEGLEK